MPAVEVSDHRDGRVAKLGFARELRLGHVCHANYATPPGLVEEGLGAGRKLRTLHHEIGAAARVSDALGVGGGLDFVDKARADRVGHGDVGDATGAEERLLSSESAVDELVNKHECAGWQLLAERAASRNRNEV